MHCTRQHSAYSVEKLRSEQSHLVFADFSRTSDVQNLTRPALGPQESKAIHSHARLIFGKWFFKKIGPQRTTGQFIPLLFQFEFRKLKTIHKLSEFRSISVSPDPQIS